MLSQVKWILSSAGKVGQGNQKARDQWNLYADLHLISNCNVNYRTIRLKSCSTPDRNYRWEERQLHDPTFPLRWEINHSLCDPTVKQTQLGRKRGRSSLCCSTHTKEDSLANVYWSLRAELFSKTTPLSLQELWKTRNSHWWEESSMKN